MAQLLGSELEKVPGGKIKLTQKVEANGVFAVVPKEFIPQLQKKYFFYVWNEAISEVRLMCSFDTTEDDIRMKLDEYMTMHELFQAKNISVTG